MMKILVTGGDGLLAYALRQLPVKDCEWHFLTHSHFDLTSSRQMQEQLAAVAPNVVVNTAAYNQVDRCEQERDRSWLVNATGPETLAKLCAQRNVKLVHYSTDYVFDGAKKAPYAEMDPPQPLNHYGSGKLAGERAVLNASAQHLVLRTSWVFGWHPTQIKTFVHTVLKAAQAGQPLKATTDQVSVPTCASDLAQWTWELIRREAVGLFHAVNDGPISRFEWAKFILGEAVHANLLPSAPGVEPVLSSSFNSTMRRPDYTVLNNQKLSAQLGHAAGSWHPGLQKMLARMRGVGID